MHAKLLQLCPTLCDAMDSSLPGSSVPGTFQAKILKWVAMPVSMGSSQPASPALAGRFFTTSTNWQGHIHPHSSEFKRRKVSNRKAS